MHLVKIATASAPGKIILAGEYAVLFGYPGLAVPSEQGITVRLENASARSLKIEWQSQTIRNGGSQTPAPTSKIDPAWDHYIHDVLHIIEKSHGPVRGDLMIASTLPLGKGMGSSTALIIALSRCLLGDNCEKQARTIEDHLNPGHSGLDFAVIWHGKPIRFVKDTKPKIIDKGFPWLTKATLIDTGTPNETTPQLVQWVKEREQEVSSAMQIIGTCADRLINGEDPSLVIRDHHKAQVALGVVPKTVQEMIGKIEKEGGASKVIGAGARTGGGGMVLGLGMGNHEKID